MSAISAPMPLSIGITSIADRQQRPTPQGRKIAPKPARTTSADRRDDPSASQSHAGTARTDLDEDAGLPADTLFTAALIANEMPFRQATNDEVLLRMSHEWIPPDSEFQLTDKTI